MLTPTETKPLTLLWEPVTLDTALRYRALPLLAPSCDYAAANLFMWDEVYCQEVAFAGGRAAGRIREENGGYRYLFPVGEGDPAPILDALLREAAARGEPLRLVGVTEPEVPLLVTHFGENVRIVETREWEDYLYSAEKLSTLAGKKLHGKRNHINAFCAEHTYKTLPLGPSLEPACRGILAAWRAGREQETAEEARAIERGFEAFEALKLEGLLLIADGAPAAFTMGSRITPEVFCVHFEKALPDVEGAFTLINREFVRALREKYPEIVLINREDDMGLDNLRAAKLSYHPEQLLKKFDATITGAEQTDVRSQ